MVSAAAIFKTAQPLVGAAVERSPAARPRREISRPATICRLGPLARVGRSGRDDGPGRRASLSQIPHRRRASLRSSLVPATAARPRPGPPGPRRRHGIPGHVDRRRRRNHRRGGLQHRADRLPGNPHRSELLPADRHADLSAHRQLRRRARRTSRRARSSPPAWWSRTCRRGFPTSAHRPAGRVPAARTRWRSPASTPVA